MTLRFLGEIRKDQRAGLEQAIENLSSGISPFPLCVTGGGVFPDGRRPRIFWAGLGGDLDSLRLLAQRADDAAVAIGLPSDERGFQPHLTLGRCRSDARCLPGDARDFVAAASGTSFGPFTVNAVHLVRSHLGPSGSRYETLRAFPLAA